MKTPSISFHSRHGVAYQVAGTEWVIDAVDCDSEKLRDDELIRAICQRVINDLGLNVVGTPLCHQFPGPGGVTALYLLSESHLACHTYPEFSLATFNLYCCRGCDPWPWQNELVLSLSAGDVRVRSIERGHHRSDEVEQ